MMTMNNLRRLFGLAVITASFGICISLVVLFRQATILTTHSLQQQPHKHSFEDSEVAEQDDDIIVDTNGPVVNAHPYHFTINNPDLCSCCNDNAEGPLILVYVQTAPFNFERRNRIRQTWAKRENYRGIRLRTIFVLGQRRSSQLQGELEMEAQRHGDIVQENFVDTYKNLTYKGVAALKWISKHCAEATYVIKVDDDTFVNMFTVVKHLKDLYATAQRSRIIMCSVWWTGRVYRRGKWSVPKWVVADRVYPPYCSGLFVIMSADVVRAAYRVSYHVPFFWIDDVYITGLLIQAMRHSTAGLNARPTTNVGRDIVVLKGEITGGEPAVRHVDISATMCNQTEMDVLYTHRTEWYKYAFTHLHDNQLFWSTWSALCQVAQHYTIPTPPVIRPGLLADNYQPLRTIFPDIELRWQRWSRYEKRRLSNEYSRWWRKGRRRRTRPLRYTANTFF